MNFELYNNINNQFNGRFGRNIDILNPVTYNEKLHRLNLVEQYEKYTDYTDKITAKHIVSTTIGEEYVIPTLGTYDNPSDIPFAMLLSKYGKFVVKCNHDSGSTNIITKNTDLPKTIQSLNNSLHRNYFLVHGESNYKNIKPKVIVEPFLDCGKLDYKFFCFDGEPKFFFIVSDRFSKEPTKFDYYNMDFTKIPVMWGNPNSNIKYTKPENYDKMLDICRTLSKPFKHVRIDLYNNNGKILFGEYTFYHDCGLAKVVPEKYDYEFGKMIKL